MSIQIMINFQVYSDCFVVLHFQFDKATLLLYD